MFYSRDYNSLDYKTPWEDVVFVNRKRELESLVSRYRSDRAEMYVLYGRRRVGKTELLRAFCADKRHVFFTADLGTESALLADFTRQISDHVFGNPDAIGAFPSWDVALDFLAREAKEQRLVVVIDEFTYLGQVNPAIPSIFQRLWDTKLNDTRLMLILCGSYVGMMERQVLGYRAPLYGRRTAQWHIQPLSFADARLFFPGYSPDDLVRACAILGGVPAYLRQFDDRRPLLDNVADSILAPGTYLSEEPRLLLLQELVEPSRYFSTLEAIANKRTRVHEIAQTIGVAVTSLPFYLSTLREIGLVERVLPVTEPHPERVKRAGYRISDNFFRFWFHYVYPNRSLLGRGEVGQVLDRIARNLDEFTSQAFETVCREHVWRLHAAGELGFVPTAVGGWWSGDGTDEIDVVAFGEFGDSERSEALLGECKWTAQPVRADVIDDLRAKAASFLADPNVRRRGITRTRLAVFARAGFAPDATRRAAAEDVLLITPAELAR
jgi:uncharacterized protein